MNISEIVKYFGLGCRHHLTNFYWLLLLKLLDPSFSQDEETGIKLEDWLRNWKTMKKKLLIVDLFPFPFEMCSLSWNTSINWLDRGSFFHHTTTSNNHCLPGHNQQLTDLFISVNNSYQELPGLARYGLGGLQIYQVKSWLDLCVSHGKTRNLQLI